MARHYNVRTPSYKIIHLLVSFKNVFWILVILQDKVTHYVRMDPHVFTGNEVRN